MKPRAGGAGNSINHKRKMDPTGYWLEFDALTGEQLPFVRYP